MNRDILDFLEDILVNLEKAEQFVEGITFEQFAEDDQINYAVLRALEIAGEATKRLPPEVRGRHPSVPWREMAGMRDRIIHGYDYVNLQIVWETVKRRIPTVKPQIRQVLEAYQE